MSAHCLRASLNRVTDHNSAAQSRRPAAQPANSAFAPRAPNARDYVLTAFGPLLFEIFALRSSNRHWLAFSEGLRQDPVQTGGIAIYVLDRRIVTERTNLVFAPNSSYLPVLI